MVVAKTRTRLAWKDSGALWNLRNGFYHFCNLHIPHRLPPIQTDFLPLTSLATCLCRSHRPKQGWRTCSSCPPGCREEPVANVLTALQALTHASGDVPPQPSFMAIDGAAVGSNSTASQASSRDSPTTYARAVVAHCMTHQTHK